MLISDQATKNLFWRPASISPFQNGSSTSGILNKSTVSAKFTCDDLCGESESYWERVMWWYFARIKCGNIVSGWLWIVLSVFRVCRGARVIRILCTSMLTLCKCLVEVICLRQPIVGSRKVVSRSVLVRHLAKSLILDITRIGRTVFSYLVHYDCTPSNIRLFCEKLVWINYHKEAQRTRLYCRCLIITPSEQCTWNVHLFLFCSLIV